MPGVLELPVKTPTNCISPESSGYDELFCFCVRYSLGCGEKDAFLILGCSKHTTINGEDAPKMHIFGDEKIKNGKTKSFKKSPQKEEDSFPPEA